MPTFARVRLRAGNGVGGTRRSPDRSGCDNRRAFLGSSRRKAGYLGFHAVAGHRGAVTPESGRDRDHLEVGRREITRAKARDPLEKPRSPFLTPFI